MKATTNIQSLLLSGAMLIASSSSLAATFGTSELTPVAWAGPGELMAILDIENGQLTLPAPGHDWTCSAHVMRPALAQPAVPHPDNRMECTGNVNSNDAKPTRIVIEFGETSPVSAWGNKFDKDPHFTVYGPVAKRLFFNLARAHASSGYGELLSGLEQCAPDGSGCTVIYFLSRRGHADDDEPAKLACSAWTTGPDIGDFECTFLMFKDPSLP